MTPEKPAATKVTVDTVEDPVHLADETIEALAGATTDGSGYRPDTLAEEGEKALTSLGQRGINLMWEQTQRIIALGVTAVALLVAAWLAITGDPDSKTAAFVFLYGTSNLVIGFYFGRTNHQRTGGVPGATQGR